MRGDADRPADIAAEFKRDHARRQRGRCAARTSAAGAAGVGGVVGDAVDRIDRLPVAQRLWHIGLAKNDRARRFQPRNGVGIAGGDVVRVLAKSPMGGEALDVERFLNGHRHAEQRGRVARRCPCVRRVRRRARPIEVADDDGVDRRVARFDAGDGRFRFGARGGCARADGHGSFKGGLHPVLPAPGRISAAAWLN
jgi:hypothetical protein